MTEQEIVNIVLGQPEVDDEDVEKTSDSVVTSKEAMLYRKFMYVFFVPIPQFRTFCTCMCVFSVHEFSIGMNGLENPLKYIQQKNLEVDFK